MPNCDKLANDCQTYISNEPECPIDLKQLPETIDAPAINCSCAI